MSDLLKFLPVSLSRTVSIGLDLFCSLSVTLTTFRTVDFSLVDISPSVADDSSLVSSILLDESSATSLVSLSWRFSEKYILHAENIEVKS